MYSLRQSFLIVFIANDNNQIPAWCPPRAWAWTRAG